MRRPPPDSGPRSSRPVVGSPRARRADISCHCLLARSSRATLGQHTKARNVQHRPTAANRQLRLCSAVSLVSNVVRRPLGRSRCAVAPVGLPILSETTPSSGRRWDSCPVVGRRNAANLALRGPQTVRKKSGRARQPPTTSNGLATAFAQVRPCFPAATGVDQQPPIPCVIVPLQRVKRRVSAGIRTGTAGRQVSDVTLCGLTQVVRPRPGCRGAVRAISPIH